MSGLLNPELRPTEPSGRIEKAIRDAMLETIAEAKEAVVKKAVADFEKLVRERVGAVAISLLDYYDIQHNGPNLVITVKITD